jgi:isoleucyl-tRNA synthetase
MSNYKETLNLPKTTFAMKANLAQREPEMLAFWQSMDLYQAIRQECLGREKFILHDGPPYANGDIHVGHAVNKILKDLIIKVKTLSGYDAPYVPGWDCHGLPIEVKVEKKYGKPGVKISAREFRIACRDYAKTQIETQKASFIRLGVSGDWNNHYATMNFRYEANIIRSLKKVIEHKHLQRGFKPVHWCMDCGSALAEAELEYMQKESHAIYVRFPVEDVEMFYSFCDHPSQKFDLGHLPLSVVIWTTTPWTLPANQAVALNSEIEYAIVKVSRENGEECLFMADSLIKEVMSRIECEDYRVLAYCRGDSVEGMMLAHPFYARKVPIVVGDHVSHEAGTGAVHTAPGHGYDDYVLGVKYDLKIDNPVNDHGCFYDDVEMVGGQHITKANQQLIDIMQAANALLFHERITHSYPHCWRHKTPLIFRATPQWFISLDQNGLRDEALRSIDKVTWFPDWGAERIRGMIADRPDWCVSRQRTWGVPLALVIHQKTGEMHPKTNEIIDKVAVAIEKSGIQAWHEMELKDLIDEDVESYQKNKDTLDVWYDSGVSHTCVLKTHQDLVFPADLYLEGSDQHRGWFQSSLLSSQAICGMPPYKKVLTHGFAVDEKGRKMSKSLGNIISPEKINKTLGADILRLWVASTDYQGELSISDQILKRTADVYRRLRNTARYFLSNLDDFDPEKNQVPEDKMLSIDRWAVECAHDLQQKILGYIEDYQIHYIYQHIHHFCSIEMGSFYLDVIKDRQYTMKADSLGRRSSQTAMYHIVHALVRWLAPIVSFTAEEIWQHIPGKSADSVFLTTWYNNFPQFTKGDMISHEKWRVIIQVRETVNKCIETARVNTIIKGGLEASVSLYCDETLYALLSSLKDELRFVLITSETSVLPLSDRGEKTDLEGLRVEVSACSHQKCTRCWHRREDVGTVEGHPELCGRCFENIEGKGEERYFA